MRGLERVKHGKSATADNWSLNDISQQHREHLFGFRQNRISSVSFIVEILDAVRDRMACLSDRAGDASASKQSVIRPYHPNGVDLPTQSSVNLVTSGS